MFCKHKWKLIDKTILQVDKDLISLISRVNAIAMFDKKLVLTFQCDICSKREQWTESLFD